MGAPKVIRESDCFMIERKLREGASLSAIAREMDVAVSTVSLYAKRMRESAQSFERRPIVDELEAQSGA
ncbi:MAG TPA: helix-turn-helix domain-containing protein [Myxococcota bacterium]|nr:helix-turn-helix domain-containing protein [Myxococcota bacterium]